MPKGQVIKTPCKEVCGKDYKIGHLPKQMGIPKENNPNMDSKMKESPKRTASYD